MRLPKIVLAILIQKYPMLSAIIIQACHVIGGSYKVILQTKLNSCHSYPLHEHGMVH